MGSASKVSWAVAASVAAVEALKDQVGLCRWNYAFRTLQQHAKAQAKSTLGQARPSSERARFALGASAVSKGPGLEDEAMIKRRKAEKAERVHHLVCWGPN